MLEEEAGGQPTCSPRPWSTHQDIPSARSTEPSPFGAKPVLDAIMGALPGPGRARFATGLPEAMWSFVRTVTLLYASVSSLVKWVVLDQIRFRFVVCGP